MTLNHLSGKHIAILGLGIENYALVKFLLKHKVRCRITVCDARTADLPKEKHDKLKHRSNISWQLGNSYNKGLDKFDILFRSPGWPIFCPGIQKALKVKARAIPNSKFPIPNLLSSPMQLFFDLCPTKNTVGVTGTKGKGTTSSLVSHILKTSGKRVFLGGNIGVAPFEFIDKIKRSDWVVLELSSFQLEDMQSSPKYAVITNFYKEHLAPADPNNPNFHRSLSSYWSAKANIFKWQISGNRLIINQRILQKVKRMELKSKISTFSSNARQANAFFIQPTSLVLSDEKLEISTSLPGPHNKENIAAAALVAKYAGVKNQEIWKGVAKFKGLEHRLEFVKNHKGVEYYNDSFATTPESTITALLSFNKPIVLLAGGAEKNSNFKQLAKEIKKRVKFLVLLEGRATPRLKQELLKINYDLSKIKIAKSIDQAIKVANDHSVSGDLILLSTACASFGMFKNYKERGRLFKLAVNKNQ